MSKYKYYPIRPKKLTVSYVQKEFAKLLKKLPAAEDSDTASKWIELYADWNALGAYIGSEGSRIYYKLSQKMNDKNAEKDEIYFREKIGPVCDEPNFTLTKAFLASKHRAALAKRYGQQLIKDYETALKPIDPINTKLAIKTGQISKKYSKKVAAATVTINGKKMTLEMATGLMDSPDENVRKASYLAARNWFLKNHDSLAKIYADLLKLRHQMGKNVGFKRYTELAYQNMGRTDYDTKMAKAFRDSVKKYMVPVYEDLLRQQAKQLGKKSLKPWDEPYEPSITLPIGVAPIDKQLDNAQRAFDKLSPILGRHFKQMRRSKLIDLENRPHKRAGAFCITFSDEAKAAILCNSVGNAEDIRTLTHEMGHAFQALESQYIEAVDLHWGTADLAEIYSMGMEFLVLKYIDEFFDKENAEKFKKSRWVRAIKIICYVCVVDEFQHWVYDNVNASVAARDKKWVELSDKYLPGINFTGVNKYRKTRWYAQSHIFSVPFYYIDYALAETGAMQIGMLAQKSHKQAVDKYLKLCKIGGTMSFLKALQNAGLRSPFEPQLVKELADQARKNLADF